MPDTYPMIVLNCYRTIFYTSNLKQWKVSWKKENNFIKEIGWKIINLSLYISVLNINSTICSGNHGNKWHWYELILILSTWGPSTPNLVTIPPELSEK